MSPLRSADIVDWKQTMQQDSLSSCEPRKEALPLTGTAAHFYTLVYTKHGVCKASTCAATAYPDRKRLDNVAIFIKVDLQYQDVRVFAA